MSEYKMSGPSAIDRILSLMQTLVLAGILVVLAMLLVEIKNLTDVEGGIVVRTIADTVDISLSSSSVGGGMSPSSPFHVSMTGPSGSSTEPIWVHMDS